MGKNLVIWHDTIYCDVIYNFFFLKSWIFNNEFYVAFKSFTVQLWSEITGCVQTLTLESWSPAWGHSELRQWFCRCWTHTCSVERNTTQWGCCDTGRATDLRLKPQQTHAGSSDSILRCRCFGWNWNHFLKCVFMRTHLVWKSGTVKSTCMTELR